SKHPGTSKCPTQCEAFMVSVQSRGRKMMNWLKHYWNSRNESGNIFPILVRRENRRRRRSERRFAERCITKHQVRARKSCVADARSYRVARRFPMSVIAELDWGH